MERLDGVEVVLGQRVGLARAGGQRVGEADVDRVVAGVAGGERGAAVPDRGAHARQRVGRARPRPQRAVDDVADLAVELDHVDGALARRQRVVDVAPSPAPDDQRAALGREVERGALRAEAELAPVRERPAGLAQRHRREVLVVGDHRLAARAPRVADDARDRRPAVGRHDAVGLERGGQVVEPRARGQPGGEDRQREHRHGRAARREQQRGQRAERPQRDAQRRRVDDPHQRYHGDRAEPGAHEVERVQPPDGADVVTHRDRDRDPGGEEGQPGQHGREPQPGRERGRHAEAVEVVVDPHQQRRHHDHQRGEDRRPARQRHLRPARAEALRPQVDEDRPRPHAEQRERDREEREVVEERRREQAREHDLERQRATREQSDARGNPQREPH